MEIGASAYGGATYLSPPILLTSLRHVNVPPTEIKLHCIQMSVPTLPGLQDLAGLRTGQRPLVVLHRRRHNVHPMLRNKKVPED